MVSCRLLFILPFIHYDFISSKTLCLVDGSSFLFRAYHAVPPLTNPKGEPTNAIYGVSNMLRKLLTEYQTDYITVIFDAAGKTFVMIYTTNTKPTARRCLMICAYKLSHYIN